MTGALILLAIVIVVGLILYLHHTVSTRNFTMSNLQEGIVEPKEVCCGMHAVCEKGLPIDDKGEIIYYDDEELDRFASMSPEDYSENDIEEFRDILETILPEDVAGWNKSLEMRNIPVPEVIRDEMLVLASDVCH